MTQEKLAILAKLDEISILLIEAGEKTPTMWQNYNLARALNENPTTLVRLSLDDERQKEQLIISNKEPSDPLAAYEDFIVEDTDDEGNPILVMNLSNAVKDFRNENKELYLYIDGIGYYFDHDSAKKAFKIYQGNKSIIDSETV